MIRVDKKRIAPGCLGVLAIVTSGSIHAESLLCAAERANGFVYDEASRSWQPASLPTGERKYRVAPANEDDLVARALKFDYEIRDAGSSKPVVLCKSVRFPDSNQETGIIMCKGEFGASFNIDRQTGRYIRSQPTGYVTRQASVKAGEGPYIEIGNCAPE